MQSRLDSFSRGRRAVILTAGALLLLAPSTLLADVTVSFDPLNGLINLGNPDTLSVLVTVDSTATDLRGFSFVFEIDPTIVAPIAIGAGSLLTGASCPHFFDVLAAGGDSIWVDAAALGCSVAGPGDIIQLTFVGLSVGQSPLRCRSGVMRDSVNATIPYTCDEGTITVDLVISTEAESWTRIKTLYRDP